MAITDWWKGPVKTEPDFGNVRDVLTGRSPDRPTLIEFWINDEILWTAAGGAPGAGPDAEVRQRILGFRNAGYDYTPVYGSTFTFPSGQAERKETRSLNEGAVITDRRTFEAYRWPEPEDFDYERLDTLAPHLPGGMKLVIIGPGGVLENAISLMGYDNLCYQLADDPELVREVFDAVGSRLVRYYEICVSHDSVGAIVGNDDWGFKTQPMLSPDDMRRHVIPWHAAIVNVAHRAGKLAALHSCGNLASLMDDIVGVIGYDGKHSYEDTILAVEQAYEAYHERIAVLGGIDVNFICRSTPAQVHTRARAMLERAAGRGGYALGTGNSVPAFMPAESVFALIAAATDSRR